MTAWLVGVRAAGMVKDTQHITDDDAAKKSLARSTERARQRLPRPPQIELKKQFKKVYTSEVIDSRPDWS